MPILGDIMERIKMNAESLSSSFTSARMQAMAEKRKLLGRFKKAGAQESLLGFGYIPKPSLKKMTGHDAPNLEADASEVAIPHDGTFGLID